MALRTNLFTPNINHILSALCPPLPGQHRVGALKLLAESGTLSPETHLILVEVFPVDTEDQIKR